MDAIEKIEMKESLNFKSMYNDLDDSMSISHVPKKNSTTSNNSCSSMFFYSLYDEEREVWVKLFLSSEFT